MARASVNRDRAIWMSRFCALARRNAVGRSMANVLVAVFSGERGGWSPAAAERSTILKHQPPITNIQKIARRQISKPRPKRMVGDEVFSNGIFSGGWMLEFGGPVFIYSPLESVGHPPAFFYRPALPPDPL